MPCDFHRGCQPAIRRQISLVLAVHAVHAKTSVRLRCQLAHESKRFEAIAGALKGSHLNRPGEETEVVIKSVPHQSLRVSVRGVCDFHEFDTAT